MQIVRMRLYWFLSLFDVSIWCFSVNEERTNMLLIYSLCIHCGWSLNNRGREKPLKLFVYYFFGGNDAKAETPVLWPPHVKSWLIGKDSDAGRDWGQEEKGTTEDEMAGWPHWLDGRESEWTPGVGDGQGGLACCDSWGRKESDMSERLIWSDLIDLFTSCYNKCSHFF